MTVHEAYSVVNERRNEPACTLGRAAIRLGGHARWCSILFMLE
jgi:hypothetical protein